MYVVNASSKVSAEREKPLVVQVTSIKYNVGTWEVNTTQSITLKAAYPMYWKPHSSLKVFYKISSLIKKI